LNSFGFAFEKNIQKYKPILNPIFIRSLSKTVKNQKWNTISFGLWCGGITVLSMSGVIVEGEGDF
jgi:hypothetical protein